MVISANKYPAVRNFYATKVRPDIPILSSAEQFETDEEVRAALIDLSEALSDGNSVSAQELSPLVSAGLGADPAVAVSLLSAMGQDAARMGQFAAPDDLHTYAIIVSKIIQDLTTPSADIGKASRNIHQLSCLQLYNLARRMSLPNFEECQSFLSKQLEMREMSKLGEEVDLDRFGEDDAYREDTVLGLALVGTEEALRDAGIPLKSETKQTPVSKSAC